MRKICIVGASGKLGRYMVQHALDRGFQVHAVCRAKSVNKLRSFEGKIRVFPGHTDDREVIKNAVAGCDAVLVVLAPWGVKQYSTNTATAVLDHADDKARLIFSCGWHISLDGKDRFSRRFKVMVKLLSVVFRALRIADIEDQVRACDRIFASTRRWTVVRGSDLEEGDSQGLPAWSDHVGDQVLESNLTRRTDFALFMVSAIDDDALIGKAPAIVGCKTESAQNYYAQALDRVSLND